MPPGDHDESLRAMQNQVEYKEFTQEAPSALETRGHGVQL
jgi:hypothetical protein